MGLYYFKSKNSVVKTTKRGFMKKDSEILMQARLWNGITGTELQEMLHCLSPKRKEFRKGSVVYAYGEQISAMGLVLRGSVHILKEDYWGNRTILAEIREGQLFGEAYACAEAAPLSVSVTAAENASVLFFDIQRVLTVCTSRCPYHTKLIQNLIAELANKNIYLTGKIEHISQRKLRDKILSYLSDFSKKEGSPVFTIPFNRQELADYLSADRSALSNELGKLRKEGILEFHRNKFRLL